MPYVIRWPHKRVIALAAAGFALLVGAQPAAASVTTADCSIPASTPVFATLGDNSLYFAVPGGTFEGDMTGWSLTGASVVSGNEPSYVDGSSDHSSLDIEAGGSAVSPTVCVSSKTPTWRFFAHAVESTGKLRIGVQLTNNGGRAVNFAIGSLQGADYTSWAATPALLLGKMLPPGLNVPLRFVFSADSKGSAWSLDDLYVDPYARG